EHEDETGQRVDVHETAQRAPRRPDERIEGHGEGEGRCHERRDDAHQRGAPPRDRAERRGGDGHREHERREAHPRSRRSASVLTVSKCSLMRIVSTAVTPTATSRSKKMPISTKSGSPSVAISPLRKIPFSTVMRPMSWEIALRRVAM